MTCSPFPTHEGIHADDGVIIGYRSDRGDRPSVSLGPGARLRTGTVVYAGARIGARFSTGHNVVVREDTTVGDDVSIWSNTVIDYGCVIGDHVKVHASCYVAQFSFLADGAFLAPGVILANDLYPGQKRSAELMTGPTIGSEAQLGCNVTVLPFVTVGERAIVGAGAVVTRDIPAGTVAYGSPAVVVREVKDLQAVESRVEAIGGDRRGYRLRAGGGQRG